MQQSNLALIWGARVTSLAGWSGKLRGAYLAPRSGKFTHVLVKRGLFGHAEPLTLGNAMQGTDGVLVLPEKIRQDSAGPGRGAIPFTQRTVIHNSDGTSLPLCGLILDKESRTLKYILAGTRGNARAIPHHEVQKLTSGSPSITVGQTDLETLLIYRSDDEALRNAMAALAGADPTGGGTFGSVHLQVIDGTAHLTGNVRLPGQDREAEEAVRQAKGVLEVQNAIVTDWDLDILIAEALAHEGLTRQGLLLVKSSLGRVALSGRLQSQGSADQAVAVAAAALGVQSIRHNIEITPLPADEPGPLPEPASEPDDDGESEPETSH